MVARDTGSSIVVVQILGLDSVHLAAGRFKSSQPCTSSKQMRVISQPGDARRGAPESAPPTASSHCETRRHQSRHGQPPFCGAARTLDVWEAPVWEAERRQIERSRIATNCGFLEVYEKTTRCDRPAYREPPGRASRRKGVQRGLMDRTAREMARELRQQRENSRRTPSGAKGISQGHSHGVRQGTSSRGKNHE